MKPKRAPLLLALALAAACGAATADILVTPSQEAQIHKGMSKDEVRAVLGRPQSDQRFRTGVETWSYETPTGIERYMFDVNFEGEGRVTSFGRRYVISGGGD